MELLKQKDIFTLKTDFQNLHSGIIGRRANPVDYDASPEKIRKAEKELLGNITGIDKKNILFLHQVHGNNIIQINKEPATNKKVAGEGDALITRIKKICLVIRTADCVPVFFFDKQKKVAAAAHSGWKGTQLDISGMVIQKMGEVYGSLPGDIHAWIYPSIGPETYEVNEDVARFFPLERHEQKGKIFVDLWAGIERSLQEKGLQAKNIFNPRICNRQNTEEFFSHRYGDRGRNLNYIFLG